ncbi:MAG: NTP transferase domain-containing protein [Magnetovibrio sp.]|nr:NTP transferase domain-containing protein [Magnetovibrio sp.]
MTNDNKHDIKIVAVIGARLNSSRLPGKQLLNLCGKPIIEHIFNRLDAVTEIDQVVLATTADDFNKPLVNWATDNNREVFPFAGDVNDLMGRIDVVFQETRPDILVYICGDSPLIEPPTLSRMLRAMLDHYEYDTVDVIPPDDGRRYIHEGFTIYTSAFWRTLMKLSESPDEREHVGFAKEKIPGGPKVFMAEPEPEIYSKSQHRISVDTPSDYQFMKTVYERWYANNGVETLVSLPWVIEQVLADENLRSINEQVEQKQVGEQFISVLLVTETGPGIGLGHLRRVAVAARALQDYAKATVHVVVVGENPFLSWMDLIPQTWLPDHNHLFAYLDEHLGSYQTLVVDVKEDDDLRERLRPVLETNKMAGRHAVAIDNLTDLHDTLDFIWSPSFYVSQTVRALVPDEKLVSGWDCYLLEDSPQHHTIRDVKSILVMLGGADTDGMGEKLPALLNLALPQGFHVHWVQGPYAPAPRVEDVLKLKWTTHKSPDDVQALYQNVDVALVSYGVSLFELLKYGMPTVVIPTSAGPNADEWAALQTEDICMCADDIASASDAIAQLLAEQSKRKDFSRKAQTKVDGLGAKRFVDAVVAL